MSAIVSTVVLSVLVSIGAVGDHVTSSGVSSSATITVSSGASGSVNSHINNAVPFPVTGERDYT